MLLGGARLGVCRWKHLDLQILVAMNSKDHDSLMFFLIFRGAAELFEGTAAVEGSALTGSNSSHLAL